MGKGPARLYKLNLTVRKGCKVVVEGLWMADGQNFAVPLEVSDKFLLLGVDTENRNADCREGAVVQEDAVPGKGGRETSLEELEQGLARIRRDGIVDILHKAAATLEKSLNSGLMTRG